MKYKCAKCGRLFLQGFINNREFQRWNKKQREFDREALALEVKQQTEENLKRRMERLKNLQERSIPSVMRFFFRL